MGEIRVWGEFYKKATAGYELPYLSTKDIQVLFSVTGLSME